MACRPWRWPCRVRSLRPLRPLWPNRRPRLWTPPLPNRSRPLLRLPRSLHPSQSPRWPITAWKPARSISRSSLRRCRKKNRLLPSLRPWPRLWRRWTTPCCPTSTSRSTWKSRHRNPYPLPHCRPPPKWPKLSSKCLRPNRWISPWTWPAKRPLPLRLRHRWRPCCRKPSASRWSRRLPSRPNHRSRWQPSPHRWPQSRPTHGTSRSTSRRKRLRPSRSLACSPCPMRNFWRWPSRPRPPSPRWSYRPWKPKN